MAKKLSEEEKAAKAGEAKAKAAAEKLAKAQAEAKRVKAIQASCGVDAVPGHEAEYKDHPKFAKFKRVEEQ